MKFVSFYAHNLKPSTEARSYPSESTTCERRVLPSNKGFLSNPPCYCREEYTCCIHNVMLRTPSSMKHTFYFFRNARLRATNQMEPLHPERAMEHCVHTDEVGSGDQLHVFSPLLQYVSHSILDPPATNRLATGTDRQTGSEMRPLEVSQSTCPTAARHQNERFPDSE